MTGERFIVHLNVADFAVAVERVVDASLRPRPVIVAPLQAARAAVYDMSDEAYGDGVRKGMLLTRATRLCRSARVLPPRFDLYRRAMTAFVNEARGYSPVLEHGAEDGHLYLDITGTHRLFGAAPDVGWRLRKQVRDRLAIEPIWSLGGSKLVAKVASRLVKPVGEYIVAGGEEERFLAPLPLLLLPGVSGAERRRLHEFSITRVGELAALSRAQLQTVFGRRGDALFALSRGIDDDAVRPASHPGTAIEQDHVFGDDTGERQVIAGVVTALAVRAGLELRTARLAARRVALTLRYSDGAETVRQATVRRGTADDDVLRRLALEALERGLTRRTRVRGCRLRCDRLHRASPQLSLLTVTGAQRRRQRLAAALDAVRDRFGSQAIRTGSQAVLS